MNNVTIKSKRNNLIIKIENKENFQELLDELKENLSDIVQVFKDTKFRVILSGETLLDDELEEVYDIIETCGLKITFIGEDTFLTKNFEDVVKADIAPNSTLESAKEEETFKPLQNETLFHSGSLRSGQKIDFEGSVVFFGDVNAGAVIKAKGNVVCLGAIRGMVHAGSGGSKECYIYALSMTPTQLRIGDIITFLSTETMAKSKSNPTLAHVDNEEIAVMSV
ncbi:MAG: septum site-determining protein MinC [Lachnospirales bacterium]